MEELLRGKGRVHDVLGQRISLLLRALRENRQPDETLLSAFAGGLPRNFWEDEAPSPDRRLELLTNMFRDMGVKVLIHGTLPQQEEVALEFADIAAECVTNAVRHGYATQVQLHFFQNDCWRMSSTDNGIPPSAPIKEEGGRRSPGDAPPGREDGRLHEGVSHAPVQYPNFRSERRTSDMTNVLIVEDHVSMRESLTLALSGAGDFHVVGEVPNADYALDFCQRLRPDLVLMDVCTEGGASGLKAVGDIRERYADIKIIVMTAFDEITYIPRAKAAGANGFIYKSRSLSYFLDVAREVIAGGSSFPEPKTIPMPQGEAPLTDREMEILRLMCKHMTSKEIAEELYISENTVKYHKANMLGKTGFTKAVDLAFYMITNGWINPLY